MDSGNSGSFQSSSGGGGGAGAGDDEYDSRTQIPISSFGNPSTYFNPNPNPLLQPPPTFFHPSSSSPSPNPNPTQFYDIHSIWPRNIRPDPNFAASGSAPNPDSNKNPGRGSDHHPLGVTGKNPKKRTRASRRAPTTVLTTDTNNFRQMVQEFTGFPDAPFSAAASAPFSGRLGGAGVGSLFPLRPSAQRILPQQPPLLNSATTATTTREETSSDNYQIPPSTIQGMQEQPQSLQNFRNSNTMFPLQSLLQTTLSQQPKGPILGMTKSDNHQSDFLSGFPSSSTRWRGQDENFGGFEGGNDNTRNIGGYKLNSSDFHQADGDQGEGNVDSWIGPSD